MKQSARFFSLLAVFVSGVSLNTQAQDFGIEAIESNLEMQMARLKAEALVQLRYEVLANIRASKELFIGDVAPSMATEKSLTERKTLPLDNLVELAD
ncbi:MAG: hypothetical protein HWE13_04300 [Gammaproteobacteria bacterium]|nr:hypothetical protein [Gammaproteobacteria bacterium]NVK87319.1 hypothetical protein [Gammaproteobacteria bacterium]